MIKKSVNKLIKYPLIFTVGLFLMVMMLVYIIKPDTLISEVENRALATRPGFSVSGLIDGSYMSSFEDYTKEQLPGRDEFIRIKSLCEMLLLKQENNGIIKGEDGFLFEKKYSLSDQLHKNISAIENFVKNTDRSVYVAIAPTSSWVYEDKLPIGAPVMDEESASCELGKVLSKYDNSNYLNLYEAIIDNSNDNDQLFYKTDHHWTSQGAYIAYLELSKVMGFEPVDFDTLSNNQVGDFYGTYYSKYKGLGIKADTITYADVDIDSYLADSTEHDNLIDYGKIDSYDKYALFMYGNPACGQIKGSCHNGRGLIVFKDSYANCLLPFLACSYEDITVIDLRYYGGSVQELLQNKSDAEVLMVYNWSFMDEDNHFYKLVK